MKTMLLVVALALLVAGAANAGYELPQVKQQCGSCHVSHSMGGGGLLLEPLPGLCLRCHEQREGMDHPIGMAPSMEVSGLPLYDGKLTCATCHDPHGRTGIESMLRLRPGELCSHCHKL